MEMFLTRRPTSEGTTLGTLHKIDGDIICPTLEDPIRDFGPHGEGKVMKDTAIPAGRYRVTITFSQRFQRDMMLVNDVPFFTGIRIHSGNTAEDTWGCIIVGTHVDSARRIHGGSIMLPKLFDDIKALLDKGEDVWLTITNPA